MKKLIMLLMGMFLSISIVSCSSSSNTNTTFIMADTSSNNSDVSDTLNFEVLKVGKADAMILTVGTHTVIIDTGEDEDGSKLVDYLQSNNITTIDYLIITHFDKDHVGGANTVIDSIDIKNVIQPNYTSTSDDYNEYVNSLNSKGIIPINLTDDMSFSLGSSNFSLYPAEQDTYNADSDELDNFYSIVTSITHGKNSFLLTGDILSDRLQELINMGNIEHTFLKVPHHGNYDKLSEAFLRAVNPKYAVITCSKKETADYKILSILNNLNTETYLTEDGNIMVTSDGTNLTIEQ